MAVEVNVGAAKKPCAHARTARAWNDPARTLCLYCGAVVPQQLNLNEPRTPMQGQNRIQRSESEKLMIKARLALEHALPRGTGYVAVLIGPGFNTYAANMDKPNVVQALEGLLHELRRDITHGVK